MKLQIKEWTRRSRWAVRIGNGLEKDGKWPVAEPTYEGGAIWPTLLYFFFDIAAAESRKPEKPHLLPRRSETMCHLWLAIHYKLNTISSRMKGPTFSIRIRLGLLVLTKYRHSLKCIFLENQNFPWRM